MGPVNGNREAWLTSAVALLTPHFEARGFSVPEVRVACGFPSRAATSSKRRRIGECWSSEAAGDKRSQIFISPTIAGYDEVLGTLAHEVVHAVVGLAAKHGAAFKRCAIAVGLEGKMTSTNASESLRAVFAGWHAKLGDYPHAQLTTMQRSKQSTRMIKCECSECGYVARTTQKWIDALGAPICPCNDEPMSINQES